MAKIKQSGAVSIFAVIFSALLLTVLTVGFIRLMISGQQQAINNDLAQSAYDSAMAGVEDAKRVVRACNTGGEGATAACEALDSQSCQVIQRSGILGSTVGDEEVPVRSDASGASGDGQEFDQAYTCVNVTMDTLSVEYESTTNQTRLVPLRATGPFDRVTIEWFTVDNLDSASGDAATPYSDGSMPPDYNILPAEDVWGENTPPVLRAQVITPGVEFTMASLDDSQASRTVFLRPGSVTAGSLESVGVNAEEDYGRRQPSSPRTVSCSANFEAGTGGYACSVEIEVGNVSVLAGQSAFLNLSTIYNSANVRISLYNGTNQVRFDGVQPLVDSTGRANDLFRRVEARLELGDLSSFSQPSYAVDIAGSICKDFSVDTEGANTGACRPEL